MSLLFFVTILAVVAHHGIYRSYLWAADADIIYAYQALLINDGLKQDYFDHPGYPYFVILSLWIRLSAFLGLVDIHRFSQLPGPSDFEPVYAQLVFAGRWLSVLLAAIFAFVVYYHLRRLTNRFWLAAIMGVLVVISPGVVTQSLIMRNELPAMLLALLAFFSLVHACRTHGVDAYRHLFWAGVFAMLSLLTKLQTIFLLLFFPLLALIFGQRGTTRASVALPPEPGARTLATAFVFGAIAFVIPAAAMLIGQIARFGGGGYQSIVALYLVLAMLAYTSFYRYSHRDARFALLALLAGFSAGLYSNLIHLAVENTASVANFVVHMRAYSSEGLSAAKSVEELSQAIYYRLPVHLLETLWRIYVEVDWAASPTQPVYWLVTVGAFVAALTDRRLALQASGLLAVAVAMETVTRLRHWVPHYQIFTDAWVYIAGALLIAGMLRSRAWSGLTRQSRKAALTALVVAAVGIAILSINFAIQDRSGGQEQDPNNVCTLGRGFLKRLPSHFDKYCSPQPDSPSLPGS